MRAVAQGLIVPSLVLGGTFSAGEARCSRERRLRGRVKYFVTNGLGVGLSFNNDIRFFSPEAKSDFPGIEDELPTYTGRLIPDLTFVIIARRGFRPTSRGPVPPSSIPRRARGWSVGVGGSSDSGGLLPSTSGSARPDLPGGQVRGGVVVHGEQRLLRGRAPTATCTSSPGRIGLPSRPSAKRARRSNEREPREERESTREQIREEPRPAPDRSSGWAVPGAASAPGTGPEPAAPPGEDAASPRRRRRRRQHRATPEMRLRRRRPCPETSSPEPASEPAAEPAPEALARARQARLLAPTQREERQSLSGRRSDRSAIGWRAVVAA